MLTIIIVACSFFVLGFSMRTLVWLAKKSMKRAKHYKKLVDKIDYDDTDTYVDDDNYRNYFKKEV